MDYRKFGETYYIRMDKGDEIISTILGICLSERTDCIGHFFGHRRVPFGRNTDVHPRNGQF